MKILIVGKPFTGKTALKDVLANTFGLSVAKATDEPSAEKQFVSRVTPLGTSYVSAEEIHNSLIAEVHPNDVKSVMEHFPDEYFFICYLKAEDEDRKKFVVTNNQEEEIWRKTEELNHKAFDRFEEIIDEVKDTNTILPSNGGNGINILHCTFSKYQAEEFASDIKRSYILYQKAFEALSYLVSLGIIVGNVDEAALQSKNGEPISMHQYALQTAHNPEDFGNLMMDYFHAKDYPKDLL